MAPPGRQTYEQEQDIARMEEETVIAVTGPLWLWSGGSWHFVTVPDELSGEIRAHSLLARAGFGSVKVEASIGGLAWRTSVFPMKSGGYLLPVKMEVRRTLDISAGDEVTVKLRLL